MYYQEWEAMHLIQIGCLEQVSQDSREYWEPIPQALLEEAYEKEKLYKQEQMRLRELQLRRIEDNIRLFLEPPVCMPMILWVRFLLPNCMKSTAIGVYRKKSPYSPCGLSVCV